MSVENYVTGRKGPLLVPIPTEDIQQQILTEVRDLRSDLKIHVQSEEQRFDAFDKDLADLKSKTAVNSEFLNKSRGGLYVLLAIGAIGTGVVLLWKLLGLLVAKLTVIVS